MFNTAFNEVDLDYLYKAFRVEPNEESLSQVIMGIRALGIRGCGVSMPFKVWASAHMDELDSSALHVGAINTISNESGVLKGYNTDFYGARQVLESIDGIGSKSVHVLGAGGVAMAIIAALRSLNVNTICVSNRTQKKVSPLVEKWGIATSPWSDRSLVKANILINATSIGMHPDSDQLPLDISSLQYYEYVMDVVINPPTSKLLEVAQQFGKNALPGTQMCLYQAMKQFEIYTGQKAPAQAMHLALNQLLNG